MELTVVLTNYMRPSNAARIVDALRYQTLPHRLFVWDNSPDQSFTGQADWVIRSSRNAKCVARWWMAFHADTPWVLIIDDDLMPTNHQVFEGIIKKLNEYYPLPVGATGVILDPRSPYEKCYHVGFSAGPVKQDTRVDILKGRLFAVATPRLATLEFLSLDAEDDIPASAKLGGGMVLNYLQSCLRDLPTGDEAWSKRPHHAQAREQSRRRWFNR